MEVTYPCPYCGIPNPSGQKFCGECGQPLTSGTRSLSSEERARLIDTASFAGGDGPSNPDWITTGSRREGPNRWAIIVVPLVIALLVGGGILFLLTHGGTAPLAPATPTPGPGLAQVLPSTSTPLTSIAQAPLLSPTYSPTSTDSPAPTDTPLPTNTPMPPTPTNTSAPTATPEPPTPTPGTPPGTILEVGQTWFQDGWELRLNSFDIGASISFPSFKLTNTSQDKRSTRYSVDNVTAIDNRGRKLPVGGVSENFGAYQCNNNAVVPLVMDPGESTSIYIPCSQGTFGDMSVVADTTDPGLTEIIIKVDGISGIQNARWHVSIKH
jgi:hypothetical protein